MSGPIRWYVKEGCQGQTQVYWHLLKGADVTKYFCDVALKNIYGNITKGTTCISKGIFKWFYIRSLTYFLSFFPFAILFFLHLLFDHDSSVMDRFKVKVTYKSLTNLQCL